VLDRDLYARGAATLLASWEAYARGSAGAFLLRLDGVAAAVFPNGPERAIYNNAVLDRSLDAAASPSAVDAMEAAYRSAGVARFAAWAHETDEESLAELGRRGYPFAESTRAMGMSLDELPSEVRGVEVAQLDWAHYLEYLDAAGFPAGLLRGVDPRAFHVLGIRVGGLAAATAIAFDHDADCGIFNMSTSPAFRRRGLGTALTVRHLRDAAERGCSTASLQATGMAERVYAAVGFRDLGRFLEHVPGA
jgi:GNAT superfamily N-acetyltransferase